LLTTLLEVAVIFVLPVAKALATPVLSIVALVGSDDNHLAEVVISTVPPPCTVAMA